MYTLIALITTMVFMFIVAITQQLIDKWKH